jgi:hypothetical protein
MGGAGPSPRPILPILVAGRPSISPFIAERRKGSFDASSEASTTTPAIARYWRKRSVRTSIKSPTLLRENLVGAYSLMGQPLRTSLVSPRRSGSGSLSVRRPRSFLYGRDNGARVLARCAEGGRLQASREPPGRTSPESVWRTQRLTQNHCADSQKTRPCAPPKTTPRHEDLYGVGLRRNPGDCQGATHG